MDHSRELECHPPPLVGGEALGSGRPRLGPGRPIGSGSHALRLYRPGTRYMASSVGGCGVKMAVVGEQGVEDGRLSSVGWASRLHGRVVVGHVQRWEWPQSELDNSNQIDAANKCVQQGFPRQRGGAIHRVLLPGTWYLGSTMPCWGFGGGRAAVGKMREKKRQDDREKGLASTFEQN